MSEQRPTREQWLAVNALTKDIAVTAGAGSGKTWVLTRRYLTQLAGRQIVPDPILTEDEQPLPKLAFPDAVAPDQIIAITFTEKAAIEMKERIRLEMKKLYQNAQEPDRSKWALYMDEVENAMITTIHGLCARLIRQYPLQADINPHFSVLQPYEAEELFQQAFEQVIADGLSRDLEFVTVVLREYPAYSFRQSIRRLFDQLRELHDPAAWAGLQEEVEKQLEANRIQAIEQAVALVSLGDQVHLAQPDQGKTVLEKQMAESFHPYWRAFREQLAAADGVWTEELRRTVSAIVQACKWKGQLSKTYKECLPLFLAKLQEWSTYMISGDYQGLATALIQFLIRLEKAYQALKHSRHVLDFTDMQIAAVRLLQNPDIRTRITQNIRYVMVDEFQDTNHMQARLVRYLAERAKLFIVGDAKQSIYGFRQADVGVFLDLQGEIQTIRGGDRIELRHNFRTVEPIIHFINRFFSKVMEVDDALEDSQNFNYRVAYDAGMLPTRAIVRQEQLRVEFIHLPLDTEEEGQEEPLEAASDQAMSESIRSRLREAEIIAKRIRGMCEQESLIVKTDSQTGEFFESKVRYGDITLLFSAMTHVHLYEYMLQRYNIPYYVVGSRNFYKRQEIVDLYHVLRLLLDPEDQLAWIGALRSPLFGVSDEGLFWIQRTIGFAGLSRMDKKRLPIQLEDTDSKHLLRAFDLLKKWRKLAAFAAVDEIVRQMIDDTGIEQILIARFGGRQKVGNLEKLIAVSRRFQNDKNGSLFAFVQHVEAMIENEVDETDADVTSLDEDVVKIMTIHQSKGLEFPVVFLPDMARKPRADSDLFGYQPGKGLGLKLAKSQGSETIGGHTVLLDGSGVAQDLQREKADRALHEERRKLYVALTRARDYLVLVGSKKPPKQQKALQLADANWFHWLVAVMAGGDLDSLAAASAAFAVRYLTAEQVDAMYESIPEKDQRETRDQPSASAYDILTETIQTLGTDLQQVPLQLLQSVFDQAAVNQPSYVTASMVMTKQNDPDMYHRIYEMGFPDWPEWDNPFHGGTAGSFEKNEETDIPADVFGSIVHRICEQLDRIEQAHVVTKQVLDEYGYEHMDNDPVFRQVFDLIRRYASSDVFQQIQLAKEVHSEVQFRTTLDGRVISGVIDKLLIMPDGTITVVDFKTNQITAANRSKLMTQYETQMDLYRRALTAIYGTPVQSKLVFLREL
ncbi:UvrD-helicase domain-containing protein [Fodinisporobacter ferrooxydans]|uniref:DNA 3'-5' helicase n=1 Tax=Fodinisporobacter ferrooxydans TaxID=2901836 RepID=A0ABY4CMY4_9BACL|nr:UvrD-helicase domain-containing protein [Alicyclobacillaceae bacterium MYW30-H2]